MGRSPACTMHPLWTGQVFKGRVSCDKWNREGWGPVELTIEVTGIRSNKEFVCLTQLCDPEDNVRSSAVWMQADGVYDPSFGEVRVMETSVHCGAETQEGAPSPYVWHGFLDG